MKNKYFVEFSSYLTKDEKIILIFFLEKYFKNEKMKFLLEELEIPKLNNSKNNFVERLSKKGIYFLESEVAKVYCPFFSSLIINEKTIKVNFNFEFIEYLTDKEKILNYSLKEVLFLKYSFSIDFFYKILKENMLKSKITIELEKFREILILDFYLRHYDLKRFRLIPLVEDINKNTDFKIEFSLIKENDIWKIVFLIENSRINTIKNYAKIILKFYKHHISNPNKIYSLILSSLNINNYEYVKSKIIFTIKNKNKYNLTFDELLENVLLNKIGSFYILLNNIEILTPTINLFIKAVYKEIINLDFSEIVTFDYYTNLTKQLYSLIPKKTITIISENIKLELTFSPKELSNITIYQKCIK
ncbi:MAG: replication initiation protein [Fusobacteriaceae bacterium]